MKHSSFFLKSFYFANTANALVNQLGEFIMVNSRYCDLLGYTEEELLNSNVSLTIPSKTLIIENKKMKTLLAKKLSNVNYSTTRTAKNGTVLSVSINAIPITDDETGDIFILKQIDSITDKKVLEAEINQKRFLLDTIMNQMPVNIYFKDLESKFIIVSKKQAEYFSVKDASELIGKSDYDFFAEEHAGQAYEDEQKIIKTGKGISIEEKEVWPDGSSTWALSIKQPLKDKHGNILGTFGISNDITAIKKSQRELRETQQKFERKNKELVVTLRNLKETQAQLVSSEKMAALGQLIAGIAHEINTPLGAINASNSNISHSLTQIFQFLPRLYSNYTKDEVHFITSLLTKADFKTIQLPSREKRLLKKEITDKFHKAGIPHSRNLADHVLYMNLQDIVDDIIVELKDIDAEKVLGAAKLLISLSKNSHNIGIATDKASNVVMALKRFIHKTADDSKTIANIKENIETVLTLNQNRTKHGIEIIKKYAEVPLIECFADELSQVWNNIITNAIQAMEGKGTLTIEIINKDANTIRVKISDTGCGIPENIREKIFIPMFTTKVSGEGTGIGLDIVKRIVDKHDGQLQLDSVVNEGTTFTIDLPLKSSKL